MTDTPKVFNAAALLDSPYSREIKDEIFLLGQLTTEKASEGTIYTLDIPADMPVAVRRPALREAMETEHGIRVPTVKEVYEGTFSTVGQRSFLNENTRLIGAGAFLWLSPVREGRESYMFTLQRNGPVEHTGMWTGPAGLASSHPVEHEMWSELVEETGIVWRDWLWKGMFYRAVPLLEKNEFIKPSVSVNCDDRVQSVMGNKSEEILRHEILEKDNSSLLKDYTVNTVLYDEPRVSYSPINEETEVAFWTDRLPVRLRPQDTSIADTVRIGMPGEAVKEYKLMATDNPVRHDFNIRAGVNANISPRIKFAFVDPEGFGRPVALQTLKKLEGKNQDGQLVPALADYVQRLKTLTL